MQFTEKQERNQYGMKKDVSELLLEHQQNHAQLTLVKGQVATSPQSVATFVYTWGGRKEFQYARTRNFLSQPRKGIELQSHRCASGQSRDQECKSQVRRSYRSCEPLKLSADFTDFRRFQNEEDRNQGKEFPR